MIELNRQHSQPLPAGSPALSAEEIQALLAQVPGYSVDAEQRRLARTYRFGNYYETLAFVNALAWIIHQEDHHPELEVTYSTCKVTYWTHTVGGLSRNDFIGAAKANALLDR